MMKPERAKIYEKCIDEANKVIDLMNGIKYYCERVLKEAEYSECEGFGGDGMNDPDNKPQRKFVRTNPSEILLNHVVKDAEMRVRRNQLIGVDVSKVFGFDDHWSTEANKTDEPEECNECCGSCECFEDEPVFIMPYGRDIVLLVKKM